MVEELLPDEEIDGGVIEDGFVEDEENGVEDLEDLDSEFPEIVDEMTLDEYILTGGETKKSLKHLKTGGKKTLKMPKLSGGSKTADHLKSKHIKTKHDHHGHHSKKTKDSPHSKLSKSRNKIADDLLSGDELLLTSKGAKSKHSMKKTKDSPHSKLSKSHNKLADDLLSGDELLLTSKGVKDEKGKHSMKKNKDSPHSKLSKGDLLSKVHAKGMKGEQVLTTKAKGSDASFKVSKGGPTLSGQIMKETGSKGKGN